MKNILIVGLFVFAGTLALAAGDGTAKGTLTINGKSVPLAYAYAWREKTNVVVFLSDVKVPPEVARDDFKPAEMAQQEKLHAVKLTIDADDEVTTGIFYTNAKPGGQFSASGMHKFEKSVHTAAAIEGKLFMEKPDDFFETTYVYSATFKAPIAAK